ncbi:MAG: FtsX-like permease family protein [bacterium]|nr:FtsX-like permease family protein [bacterium]
MFRNYFKIAIRNILRQKGYSLINIGGLAIGMACTILIALWIQDELSFDQFHEKGDRLYQVLTTQIYSGKSYIGGTPPAFGPALEKEYPEVEKAARMQSGTLDRVIRHGDKIFTESIQAADFSLLQMFTFPVIKGNLEAAIGDVNSIVISERIAKKYFGAKNPVGETLTMDAEYDLKVAAVIKNIPQNSRIRFDILVPVKILESLYKSPGFVGTWTNLSFRTLALLRPGVSAEAFSAKIDKRIIEGNGNEEDVRPFLCKYKDIHVYGVKGRMGNIGTIFMFGLIAFIILLIACINYMNLATARSSNRSKEVGLRKVVGAYRKDIIKQFFSESLVVSFIAFILAHSLASLFLPLFNSLTAKQLALDIFNNWQVMLGTVVMFIVSGIVAGSYPALFLSAFSPAKVLKGTVSAGAKGALFRKVLVVTQFAVSIGLIICTVVVTNQLEFFSKKNLGFEKDQLVYIPLKGDQEKIYNPIKTELLSHPDVLNISTTQSRLTGVYWNDHNWKWEGREEGTDPLVTDLYVDSDFADTFGIKTVKGSFFPEKFKFPVEKNTGTVVINETFMKIMKSDNPVGQVLSQPDGTKFTIIGVVKDFHFKPLNQDVEPIMLQIDPKNNHYLYMKIRPGSIDSVLKKAEAVYRKINPAFPFEYRFLDEDFEKVYLGEKQLGKIFRYFAFLAIFISCLGLFGLASFMAEQRTKEIGIRKVLGATETGMVVLLSKEFVKWVIMANIIAWPLAYYLMNDWLKEYAFRTELGISTFLLSGLAALLIALGTVAFQSIKADVANSIDYLKYE